MAVTLISALPATGSQFHVFDRTDYEYRLEYEISSIETTSNTDIDGDTEGTMWWDQDSDGEESIIVKITAECYAVREWDDVVEAHITLTQSFKITSTSDDTLTVTEESGAVRSDEVGFTSYVATMAAAMRVAVITGTSDIPTFGTVEAVGFTVGLEITAGLDIERSPDEVSNATFEVLSPSSSIIDDDCRFVAGQLPRWSWEATTLMGGGSILAEGTTISNGTAQGGFHWAGDP